MKLASTIGFLFGTLTLPMACRQSIRAADSIETRAAGTPETPRGSGGGKGRVGFDGVSAVTPVWVAFVNAKNQRTEVQGIRLRHAMARRTGVAGATARQWGQMRYCPFQWLRTRSISPAIDASRHP